MTDQPISETFLTGPSFKGKAFAKEVAKHLINDLVSQGITTFTLGTTEENISACKADEALGFVLIEKRKEIELYLYQGRNHEN